jgi:hypothetical protein
MRIFMCNRELLVKGVSLISMFDEQKKCIEALWNIGLSESEQQKHCYAVKTRTPS